MLLLAIATSAQVNVQLRGTGENLAGKSVELYCYDDMLTMTEHRLDESTADSNGAFSLECYLTYPRLLFIQIEDYSQSFFAEPGRTYEIFLPYFRWEQDEERNVHFDPIALPLQFIGVPDDDINLQIMRFDAQVDSFLSENRVYFDPKFKPSRRWMDSLEHKVVHWEFGISNTFFERYATFSLAEMRYAMRFSSRKNMLERFINGRPVLYHDESYMRLLLSLMDGMVSMGTKKLPKWKLTEWVERRMYDVYIDSLGTDPLLQDEQLRELAALVAMKESYYDADYDRGGVRYMVQQIGSNSKFAEHRTLAQRLEESFHRAEQGETAPHFLLPDTNGTLVDLDSLAGKWIYLSFVRVGDPACLRELETMAFYRDSIYSMYNDVEFVSICCDRDPQKMHSFLKSGKRGPRCRWLWLHFDGDYRLLEHYGVVSYPTFLLINPEGRLHYSVTPPPASGILMHGPWEMPVPESTDPLQSPIQE